MNPLIFLRALGLVLILGAIILVTLKDHIAFKFNNGELWAFLCATTFGAGFANDAFILRSFDLWTYAFLVFLLPGLLTLIYLGKELNDLKHLVDKESAIGFIFSAFIYTIAVLTLYAAYQIGRNAAQIASITPTYSILIVILAAIFLKERDRLPRKLTAVVLAVFGILLLSK